MKNLIQKNGKTYLESEYKTGNQWYVALITGLDPKWKFCRTFLNKQRAGVSIDLVQDGSIVEEMEASHSGKNKNKRYFKVTGTELVQIEEREVILSFS